MVRKVLILVAFRILKFILSLVGGLLRWLKLIHDKLSFEVEMQKAEDEFEGYYEEEDLILKDDCYCPLCKTWYKHETEDGQMVICSNCKTK